MSLTLRLMIVGRYFVVGPLEQAVTAVGRRRRRGCSRGRDGCERLVMMIGDLGRLTAGEPAAAVSGIRRRSRLIVIPSPLPPSDLRSSGQTATVNTPQWTRLGRLPLVRCGPIAAPARGGSHDAGSRVESLADIRVLSGFFFVLRLRF